MTYRRLTWVNRIVHPKYAPYDKYCVRNRGLMQVCFDLDLSLGPALVPIDDFAGNCVKTNASLFQSLAIELKTSQYSTQA